MSDRFDKLKTLLLELFQLDQPDLDFGIYRILHARSAEVTAFLDRDLLPQVRAALAMWQPADRAAVQAELDTALKSARELGAEPETLPRVQQLRHSLAEQAVDLSALEDEVYDRLYSFFRRYYSEGDFLSKRVYKAGVYAIPYEGEEVKLHWANADQYYIKTSEYLRDYAFRLRPEDAVNPMRVHFRLVDAAEGEHGNVKAGEGRDRRFSLATDQPLVLADGDLLIRFTYEPAAEKQKDLNTEAERRILATTDPAFHGWIVELAAPHTRADGTPGGTRLRTHLDRYTARNTFDYFIHKDLGGFLRRELDFYIKNEVMHLDDVEAETSSRHEQTLSKIRIIRRIAGKIIDFLAQLEDFQKKLWLKKKFVVATDYCVALDSVPEAMYDEIAANDAQREEWVRLLAIDKIAESVTSHGYTVPLSTTFLKDNPSLMVDTRHFQPEFTERLLDTQDDIGERTDCILIQSENFQALRLIDVAHRQRVDAAYLDPPYNTDAGPIAYKNGYRHSSWLSLIDGRFAALRSLLTEEGIFCVTIDDAELHLLKSLLGSGMADFELLGSVVVKNNPAGRTGTVGFSICHEYALFYGRPSAAKVGRLEHSEAQRARYKENDDQGAFEWTNFRKHGGLNTYRTARPRQFYPIYVKGARIRIPSMVWNDDARDWTILDQPESDEEVLRPIDEAGRERIWDFVADTAREELPHLLVRKDSRGMTAIYRKWRLNAAGLLPQTVWDKSDYSAAEYGTNLLADIFGRTHTFTFPKSVHAVADSLRVANLRNDDEGVVLDFFAGSGTTGHAVVNLNREDGGRRKFILVEMGDYFDTVLVPRLKKVTYTPEWKDGRPKRRATPEEVERSPRIMKVMRLESYEDTLNNLETTRTPSQQAVLDFREAGGVDGFREQYILRYMLDVETRGSQSLLNVAAFADPSAYRLKVKRPGSDEGREADVDLLETFNWLIGLTVSHIAAPRRFSARFARDGENRLQVQDRLREDPAGPFWFRTVTGTTPDGRRTLVIWRNRPGGDAPEGMEQDNLVLDEWFTRQGYSSQDSEFDLIYVNGDNNLENLRHPDDTWKVRVIEDDFHRLMFDTEGA